MSRDEDDKSPRLFDVRTIERNIRKGLTTRKDYDKYLKTLPDVSDKIAPPEALRPVTMGAIIDDDDDFDDETDEVSVEAATAGSGEGAAAASADDDLGDDDDDLDDDIDDEDEEDDGEDKINPGGGSGPTPT